MSEAAVEQRKTQLHRDRWSALADDPQILSFSERLTPEQMKQYAVFEGIKDPILEGLTTDVALATWSAGSVLFEEGTYVDVAFFIVEGRVSVSLERLGDLSDAQPIFEQRAGGGEESIEQADHEARQAEAKGHEITRLSTMDADLKPGEAQELGPGEYFGEIGAMSGWPQSVTARTLTDTTVVQIRLPALRTMRRRAKALKKHLDEIYRERSLLAQLATTPLLAGCDEAFLTELKDQVELVSGDPDGLFVTEGEAADALYIVRSGFVKLEQSFGEGEVVVSYLSKGMSLGEIEQLLEGGKWEVSARSVEYSELLKIPAASLRTILQRHPDIEARLWESATRRIKEMGAARRDVARSEFTKIALDRGLVEGNSILVIDLTQCTRCDDCMRGCAAAHDGRPRFVREGHKVGNLLVARSCYHCQDPVCLVGCPTGAIHRKGLREVVAVNENVCIGCGSCSDKCPYDNIVMHDTGKTWPDDMVPETLRGEDRQVASKCDLCRDTGHGPACVASCPQGCAHRVGSVEAFRDLLDL
ncbi:MAG: cyclic nucleotide-binding domain-containing protein [Myxococcota bacterium]|nr:cyclic nucleotide-binding domain-containing protein [Myxococcota bacterium]